MTFRRSKHALWIAGLAAAALAGCGGAGSHGGSTSGVAGASTAARKPKVVTVRETEFELEFSTMRFTPGTYTFVAKDAGHVGHALEIDGPGVSDRRTSGTIAPGGSASLTVTLKAGDYEIWCPVDGHKGLGMDAHIHVGTGAAGAAQPASGGSAWG